MWNLISEIVNKLEQFKQKLPSIPSFKVDDEAFREVSLNGSRKTILWSELEQVDILTTDDGPLFEDLYYIIRGNGVCIYISQLTAAEHDLLGKFDRLPGFKWSTALAAMTCVQRQVFPCWDKSWPLEQPESQ